MSRAFKKAVKLATLRQCVTKLVRATRDLARETASRERGEEFDEAVQLVDMQMRRVIAERAELVKALLEAIELYEGMLRSDYAANAVDNARLNELAPLNAVAAKYGVKA